MVIDHEAIYTVPDVCNASARFVLLDMNYCKHAHFSLPGSSWRIELLQTNRYADYNSTLATLADENGDITVAWPGFSSASLGRSSWIRRYCEFCDTHVPCSCVLVYLHELVICSPSGG